VIDTRALDDHGFTTVDLVDATCLEELRALHDSLGVAADDPYWASSVHGSRALARSVHESLLDLVLPAIDAVLPGHAPFLAAVIAKGRGGGRVGLHPDWTYVDERTHRSRLFWCPLVDTDESSGAMVVVPGSHRALRGLRGSGDFPSPVAEVEDDLWARHVVTVPLRAGQAIVWDAALLHGSWPNGGRARPAAAIAVAPSAAGLVHFHLEPGAPLAGYAIDAAYYLDQPYAARPTGFASIEPWDDPVRTFATVDEVVAAPRA
jgi:hypothetical protein